MAGRLAYPRSYEPTTDSAILLVKEKLSIQHRHRILILDYIELAKTLISCGDPIAKALGQHTAKRLERYQ
jgi:hypothetical protein